MGQFLGSVCVGDCGVCVGCVCGSYDERLWLTIGCGRLISNTADCCCS